ncbi:hypothetical protein GF420_03080 [candidate division GN15 bacterium]|nr:hypothetical protein [candidate division GN15 bacterium]
MSGPMRNRRHQYLPGLLALLCVLLPCTSLHAGIAVEGQVFDGRLELSQARIDAASGTVRLAGEWRYHPGDDPAWADPDLPDTGWSLVRAALPLSDIGDTLWHGIGWFRLHVTVDSSLVGRPLGLSLQQFGASEIYVDGRRLYTIGQVGVTLPEERSQLHGWPPPLPITFDRAGDHLLAIRYSNHRWAEHLSWGGHAGFDASLGGLDEQNEHYVDDILSGGRHQAFFTAFALSVALLHLLLFVFSPGSRGNLFFAVLSMSFAGMCFLPNQMMMAAEYNEFVIYMTFFKVSLITCSVFGPLMLYSVFYPSQPRHAKWLAIAGGVILIACWWLPLAAIYIIAFASLAESLRVVILAMVRRRQFAWVIGLGFLCFMVAAGYQMLPELAASVRHIDVDFYPWYMWGVLALLIAMSVYLARNFAMINRRLAEKLTEVQELSQRAVEQERQVQEAKTERKLLQANLEHQARELEKARALEQAHRELSETNRTLRETQSQLVQSEKMASLGSLVAGIAHELNTPIGAVHSIHQTLMRAIANIRELLEREQPGRIEEDPVLKRNFAAIDDANRVITSGADRVTTIVRRLRSFARLDEAELKTVDIHEGIEDTLTLIHHEIKHHITIDRRYGTLPEIACYPGQLNQVFLNLLNNARQAITGEGTITIQTSHSDGWVIIKISDTGSGIAPEHVKRIFDPGFTTKGVGVGTGLGLSICYQIIRQHRGDISVDSTVGEGTTFTIRLPDDLDKRLENE